MVSATKSSLAIKNNKLSPDIAAEDNRLSSSTPVGYDRLSSGTTIKDAPPLESQVTILSKYSKTSPSESSSANLFATESLGFSISTHTELAQESNTLLTDSTTLLDLKGSFTALLIDFSTSKTDMQDIYQFFTTDNKSTIAKYTATSDVQEKVNTNLYSSGSTFTFDYNKKSLSSRIEPNIYLTTVDDIESASSFSQLYSSCYQPSISHWPTFSSQSILNSNQNINTNADRLNSVSFKSLAASTDIDVTTHQIPFHPTPTDQDITFNPFEEYSKVPIVTANDTLRALAKINEELAIHPILTVQTAKIYGQGLNQLISKLITNASNTELIIALSQILDRFFLRVADNLFLGQSLNITDGETGQTINILTGIYPFLRNEITQGAASDDIISDIITCKIDPYPPGESELNFHYSIIKSENIPHQYINGTKSQVLKCVYLNLTTRKWSHSGCTLNPEISKYAMCNCNHLTHFAIMFQFSNLNDVQSLLAPIIIIEYIGIGFSIICIAMTLIVYGILRLKSDRFIIHRNLLVALFLLQCSIIAGSQSVENKSLPKRIEFQFITSSVGVNTVVMICVVKVTVSSTIADAYKNDSRKGRLQGTKSMVKASAILTPILGLTWLLALIPITKQTIVFTYLSVILNSCQGITIFVFHCVLSSEVRQKYTLLISRRSAVQSSNKASLFIEDNANLKTDNSVKKGKSLFKLLHFY
ncbi:uncharacterized protein TRIADDRAFT_61850 [Trichoplax adhaerens]|uniref:GAIN-B domain-containing protein n=1 Tax=Trichoplax adhaerens TaxID=10228 RepID=B3SC60_TRIAD|nr:hypothetical protein TRIADDRAFT_61850 [Trichoplax adhaerens]EDV19663.1 hypothetical protein TRIADDRAFT_61850 [Trichoplax adhaerens]|eukprot:XP_002117820.1 hypothetical protein TRIADDRAFT_61850 [Trichoplax adhaerens]